MKFVHSGHEKVGNLGCSEWMKERQKVCKLGVFIHYHKIAIGTSSTG
jgi:hypothetical protein